MEIRDYLNILRKRGWIIIVLALLAAGAAFAISQVQTPAYKAKATVSVVPARPDWGLGNTAKDLLRNFAVNIKTHKTARQVIDAAQLDLSTYDLLAKVYIPEDEDVGQYLTARLFDVPGISRTLTTMTFRAF